MLSNYLKVAFRSLSRQATYSIINVIGLSVGISISLLILLWSQHELQIDHFHKDIDRIHSLVSNVDNGESGIMTWGTTPFPLINYIAQNFPEVEKVGGYDPTNKKKITIDDKSFLEDGLYATSSFFEVLSFPFLEGNADFSSLQAIAISERLANKLFEEDWKKEAMGATLGVNGEQGYTINGVFANPPDDASLQFDFVLNINALHAQDEFPWGNFDSRILFKLKEGASVENFADKATKGLRQNNPHANEISFYSQTYGDVYLNGRFENGHPAGGRIEYVRIFFGAAFFLLLIACINFMNLATARATRRAKEVGVRKAIGAGMPSLITQFMIEAALLSSLSLLGGIALARWLLPHFEDISGKALTMNLLDGQFWILALLVGLGTTLLAGSYPAFVLSSFKVVNVIKGNHIQSSGGRIIRKGLVVFQFVLSAFLVVGALSVHQQIAFIKHKNLGLDKNNVMYFRLPPKAQEKMAVFREEMLRLPGVHDFTYSSSNPLSVGSQSGDPSWEGMDPEAKVYFNILRTDHHFLDAMNIPLAQGRNFSGELSSDTLNILINEKAAEAMKLDDPLHKRVQFWGTTGTIVGVVKNFHTSSLHLPIEPLMIVNYPEGVNLAMLRLDEKSTDETIAGIEGVFDHFAAGFPFRYDFLDDRYMQMYKNEQRTGQLARWFAVIALFVSCLGLLGLSAFIAEQRTREIGIRKILGASVINITTMLSKDFLKLVLLALAIGLPIGWYLIERWLSQFTYRVELSWWIFAFTVIIALSIALLTVGIQSVKAASANPVRALRQN